MSFLESFNDRNDTVPGQWSLREEQEQAGMARLVAPGLRTRGDFGLFECTLEPGAGAVPHVHQGFSESFYVLDGRLRLRAGDDVRLGGPGDFVYIPPGGVHVFRNDTDDVVRFLLIFSPGAPREAYFRDMAALATRSTAPTADEIDELASRHDQVNLRDPRWALPSR